MSIKDYSKNNHCPVCNKLISNRAKYCYKHLYILRGQKKGDGSHYSKNKKCIDCGKPISNPSTRCNRCEGLKRKTIFGKFTYSKNKKCIDCGKPISNYATRCRSCSKKGIIRLDMRGEKNPRWNGGWNPYYGPNWESQRKLALKRDNYTCQLCGAKSGQIDVHHQIPFSKCDNYKEANSLDNLITVCQKCHLLAEKQEFSSFIKD